METSRGKSLRTSGSPPVRRTSPTPIEANSPTSRSISSKVRISERSSQGSPSAGMQYWQRKLQRSVTETRRSPIRLPCPSKSGSRTYKSLEPGARASARALIVRNDRVLRRQQRQLVALDLVAGGLGKGVQVGQLLLADALRLLAVLGGRAQAR